MTDDSVVQPRVRREKAADLTGAMFITSDKLKKQAASLEGAIMPDGTKHP